MAPAGIFSAFARDLALVFANCQAYNSEESRIWEHAARLAAKASALVAAARSELGLPVDNEDLASVGASDDGGNEDDEDGGHGISGHSVDAVVREDRSEEDDDGEEFEEEDEEEDDDDGDDDFDGK